MAGPTIQRHLATCSEENFQEIVQIFRHDIVLYLGMLLSWGALFEAETAESDSPSFTALTAAMMASVQQSYTTMQQRLHPPFPQLAGPAPCAETVHQAWDTFYNEFSRAARHEFDGLRQQTYEYITAPEFQTIIQRNLGPAAGDEPIDQSLVRCHEKLMRLLDAAYFDQRVAEALESRSDTTHG